MTPYVYIAQMTNQLQKCLSMKDFVKESERFSWHGSSALAWINQRTSGIVNIVQNIISNVIFAYTKFILLDGVVRDSDGQISWTYPYMVAWTVSRKSFLGRKTRFQSTLGYFTTKLIVN